MKHVFSVLQCSLFVGLLALLLGPSAWAQAPAWQMAAAAGGPDASVLASAADAAGNVYVAGYFSGAATFGSTNLVSAGQTDAFVAKWSSATGRFVWARQMGGVEAEQATGLAVQGSGVYVVGHFSSAAVAFGSTVLSNPSYRLDEVFVAKLTDAGSHVWAQQAGGAYEDRAYAVAVSGSAVYVAGEFNSRQANFGALAISLTPMNGVFDVFVTRLTDAGATSTFDWVRNAGGGGDDRARALAVADSVVYVGGWYQGTQARFGSTTLDNVGAIDAFVAKMTRAGDFVWAQRVSGTVNEVIRGVAVSGANVYVVGSFTSPTTTLGNTQLVNTSAAGLDDVFVAKLTDTGSFVWAQRAGGSSIDVALAVAASGANVYVTGFCAGGASFGPAVPVTAGSADVYVAKLVDAGNTGSFAWVQTAGGTGFDQAAALVLRGRNVYTAGAVTPPASFSALSVALPGTTAGFLASFTDPTLTATTAALRPESIGLFPSPAHGRATVQLPPGTGPATLTLLDALGRPVRTQTATASKAELDLTGLAPGLYAVQVQAGAAITTQKLLVE